MATDDSRDDDSPEAIQRWRKQRLTREFPDTAHFNDPAFEWRRRFAELLGTCFLVLAGGGAEAVDKASGGQIGRVAAMTAPGLTVMAVILFMGAVSGAHLNPVVSLAFALRGDFPWRRVPFYIAAQLIGAAAASLFLRLTFDNQGRGGLLEPKSGFGDGQALAVEIVLTLGLVSVILGTASTAQNVGDLSAIGVGGYIVLAGLWSSPVSGAAMNPARAIGPALVEWDGAHLWLYLVGPLLGALAAVGAAWILRGPGGDPKGREAAQGKMKGKTQDHLEAATDSNDQTAAAGING